MTYQVPFNGGIGVSGPGFASRGKGNHIKRLSFAPPSKIATIDESEQIDLNGLSTPRTSRGHMLAGLRTAPKSAALPDTSLNNGLENSRYATSRYSARGPQTASTGTFRNNQVNGFNNHQRLYAGPEQVLAPPALNVNGSSEEQMDAELYNELLATNAYLAEQQRALQQQLLNVTVAAQQLSGLNLGITPIQNNQYQNAPAMPTGLYNQQLQQGMQPIVQAVPNSPGLYTVYNPLTGQSSFFMDNSQLQPARSSPPSSVQSPVQSPPPPFQRQFSGPRDGAPKTMDRSVSPPKSNNTSPQDVKPLPPPSATAFRLGHRKQASSVNVKTGGDWTRPTPQTASFPKTPMTGGFGPGHGRAGEHPSRQPRGPPPLQELEEKPTANHEGSKNFATRQRRRAIHDLVKAGRERQSETRQTGSGSGTPGSESEFNFSVSPSEEGGVTHSRSLSSKPSLGSLRAVASGAIGSERKEKSRERGSVDSGKSSSSEDGFPSPVIAEAGRRSNTPSFLINSVERRKTPVV